MAGPIALAAALRRIRSIECPFCGQKKAVSRERVTYRVCPRCHRRFPDPAETKAKRR